MDLLIAPYTVTKEQADAAPATGTPGWATDGNPSTNKPATQWPAYAFNAMQEELVTLIQGGGQTLNRNDNTLLFKAVQKLLEPKAPLVSPVFSGTPTAPTPAAGDQSTRLATTAFVKSAISSATVTSPGIIQIASTAQAQAMTDDMTALTPKKLADAFGGSNSSLPGSFGYLRLPGGLILQWGSGTVSGPGINVDVTLPITFPTQGKMILVSQRLEPQNIGFGCDFINTSTIRFKQNGSAQLFVSWQALGY
ncbi:hypothetical protein LMG26846_05862 [Achromobacter insuavis]|uniref:gp53-like domain-containing protein n=1 Tax=Achromobacter insuavis TaxID=1287735 RepID=UPI00146981DF|nr:hypothetical protein [Achromobacter insuavis]CAB3924010.1 hypothetical protein LMG26846_05862 [Achromobacter insuavis]